MEAWRADRLRWMTREAAALKPDTDVRVQPETCHNSDAGPRPKLATNCSTCTPWIPRRSLNRASCDL